MPAPAPCPSQDQWQRLHRGEADPEQVEVLTRHLEQCPGCTATVDFLESSQTTPWTPSEFLPPIEDSDTVAGLIERLKDWLPARPLAPERIGWLGHYRLLYLLGSGGMGAVYLAQDERLPRRVAVKTLLARPGASPELSIRFRGEAEAIARLKHPNIVTLYEVNEDQGQAYLVMEYVAGGTLGQRLAQAVLPPRQAAEVIEALALAVAAAHELGIIHRDLKPGNVLIDENGTPRLADFGLAKQTALEGDQTRAGALLGTPSYMAPEQAEGREVGPPADVYGLGAVLYECLTGRPPFLGATELDTLDQVRRLDAVPPRQIRAGVPRAVEIICLKCLEKDPRRRYASARALAHDLRRFLNGEPIQARPAGPVERLTKWAGRKPAAAALVLACGGFALLAAVGGGWHYTRITAALKRAEDGEARAKERSERITRQYREATATISRMFATLANRKVEQIPELRQAQQAQLEAALAFFERATREEERPAPEVLLDLALFSGQVAHYQVHSGQGAAAQKNLRRAIAIFEPHVEEHPKDFKARATLAGYFLYLGALRTGARQFDEAESFLRRSLDMMESLIRDDPANATHKGGLAEVYHNLGDLCLASQGPAAEWYEKAVAIRRRQMQEEPNNEGVRVALAETTTNLGLVYGRSNQPDKAIGMYGEAIAILGQLARENPAVPRYGTALGNAHVNLGLTLLTRGEVGKSLEQYTLAREEYQRVRRHEPTFQVNLLSAHGGRAQCLAALKRYSEALPEWDKVIELADAGSRPGYRLERAVVAIRLGDYRRAAEDADAVARGEKATGVQLYNAACIFGLCAAGEPGKRDPHAGRAVALLQSARKAGHFDNPANVAHMKTDTDLDPLRGRSDYTALLRQLEGSK